MKSRLKSHRWTIVGLLLVCVLYFAFRHAPSMGRSQEHHENGLKHPKFKQFVSGGVEMFLAEPTDMQATKILFVFHGCTHSGLDWFRLPEEGVIVREALKRGYAVLAPSSEDRDSGCWSENDLVLVPAAFRHFTKSHTWAAHLPVFLIGASSGGTFASELPTKLLIHGLFVQIARIPADVHREWISPPPKSVFLLFMNRDSMNKRSYEDFAVHVDRNRIDLEVMQSHPCEITPERLAGRVYGVSDRFAKEIVEALKAENVIDATTLRPIRSTISRPLMQLPDLRKDTYDSVQEEVKVCWAAHELTGEFIVKVLDRWDSDAPTEINI